MTWTVFVLAILAAGLYLLWGRERTARKSAEVQAALAEWRLAIAERRAGKTQRREA